MTAFSASILILEDNSQMRMLLRAVLSGLGFRHIACAESNAEAIDLCETRNFDLFLVDQFLRHGETGLSFVKWLRNSDDSPDQTAPIVTITSFAERARILDAINAGIDEFLVKPLRPIDLARRLQAIKVNRRKFVRTADYFGPCRRRLRSQIPYHGPLRRADDVVACNDELTFELD